jgi:transcriptional regulator GlxA family with amidase domain
VILLAAAGVLPRRRRVVTHWLRCAELQSRFPDLRVETDAIYLRDGKYWTSGGVTSGIDLALALIERDLGADAAMEVARYLVVFAKRPGGQAQFRSVVQSPQTAGGAFDPLLEWLAQNLESDLSVEQLAERAHMSPRHFSRRFQESLKVSPAKYVETLRVERARRLIEEGRAKVADIAQRCGFGDDERMRRAFLRQLKVSPAAYREHFSRAQA